ncbi:unnamed protein product [Fusarium langsethiae]|nr:unnamed protein product [Fusarium langsethiae]
MPLDTTSLSKPNFQTFLSHIDNAQNKLRVAVARELPRLSPQHLCDTVPERRPSTAAGKRRASDPGLAAFQFTTEHETMKTSLLDQAMAAFETNASYKSYKDDISYHHLVLEWDDVRQYENDCGEYLKEMDGAITESLYCLEQLSIGVRGGQNQEEAAKDQEKMTLGKLASAEKDNKSLRKKIETIKSQTNKGRQAAARQASHIQDLQVEKRDLDNARKSALKDLAYAKRLHKSLNNQLQSATSTIGKREADIEGYVARISELQHTVKTQKNALEATQNTLRVTQQLRNTSEETSRSLQHRLGTSEKKKKEIQQKNDWLAQDLTHEQRKVRKLEEKVENMKKQERSRNTANSFEEGPRVDALGSTRPSRNRDHRNQDRSSIFKEEGETIKLLEQSMKQLQLPGSQDSEEILRTSFTHASTITVPPKQFANLRDAFSLLARHAGYGVEGEVPKLIDLTPSHITEYFTKHESIFEEALRLRSIVRLVAPRYRIEPDVAVLLTVEEFAEKGDDDVWRLGCIVRLVAKALGLDPDEAVDLTAEEFEKRVEAIMDG